MNSVNIIGNMTGDIEIKQISDNFSVGKFSIGLNKKIKKNGEYVDKPQFFEVTAYNKTAENIAKFFGRGSKIGISGELDFESWENDKGKQSKITIICHEFTFIDKKNDTGVKTPQKQKTNELPEIIIEEQEIPF